MPAPLRRKPEWLKVRAPGGERYVRIKDTLRRLDLHTVCEEAHCPNVGECWAGGTATMMLLGDTCTRGCRFCAVTTGNPQGFVDPREPEHTARALATLDLSYVVLTMVNRDDLLDGGAAHVASTVRRIKAHRPDMLVETLVGDFQGRRCDVATVVTEGQPDVFAHNVEVVERLQRAMRDARCGYRQSLDVLGWAKAARPAAPTKSSLMLGAGETLGEVRATMRDLRDAGVDALTLGQYLRPSHRHASVAQYLEPAVFDELGAYGRELGYAYVASGPLVRSSYRAAEAFLEGALRRPAGAERDARFDRYGMPIDGKHHLRLV